MSSSNGHFACRSAANDVLLPFACNALGCEASTLVATLHHKLAGAVQAATKPQPAAAKGKKRPAQQPAQAEEDAAAMGAEADTNQEMTATDQDDAYDETDQDQALDDAEGGTDMGDANASTGWQHTSHRQAQQPALPAISHSEYSRQASNAAAQQRPTTAASMRATDLQARAQQLYGVRPLKSVVVQEEAEDEGDGDDEWLF